MALRRTTKQKLYRYTVYAVLIAIAVWVAFSTDWSRLGQLFFNPEVAAKMLPGIITTALVNTLWFTAVAFAGGLLLGVILALMKLSRSVRSGGSRPSGSNCSAGSPPCSRSSPSGSSCRSRSACGRRSSAVPWCSA